MWIIIMRGWASLDKDISLSILEGFCHFFFNGGARGGYLLFYPHNSNFSITIIPLPPQLNPMRSNLSRVVFATIAVVSYQVCFVLYILLFCSVVLGWVSLRRFKIFRCTHDVVFILQFPLT